MTKSSVPVKKTRAPGAGRPLGARSLPSNMVASIAQMLTAWGGITDKDAIDAAIRATRGSYYQTAAARVRFPLLTYDTVRKALFRLRASKKWIEVGSRMVALAASKLAEAEEVHVSSRKPRS
jgi:hypothetical protein